MSTKIKYYISEMQRELSTLEKFYLDKHYEAMFKDNFDKSQSDVDDSFLKIRQIKQWKNVLNSLNDEDFLSEEEISLNLIDLNDGSESFHDDKSSEMLENTLISDNDEESFRYVIDIKDFKDEDYSDSVAGKTLSDRSFYDLYTEEEKVGQYVRRKLSELCKSGYEFSNELLIKILSKEWSKKVLNINKPLAIIYNPNISISNQIKDHNGNNRYWREIFSFGDIKLLICSQWYKKDKKYFDDWYESLVKDQVVADKIVGFKIFNKSHKVTSWKEILINLCNIMTTSKPYIAARFGRNTKLNASSVNFSDRANTIAGEKIMLDNGIWINLNKKESEFKQLCESVLDECGYSIEDLIVIKE